MPVELKVPEVGESITEVYIGEWHKAVGERVERDEDVVELESEKATFDAPAPAAGKLAKILKQSGDTAEVGEVIAYIEEDGEGSDDEGSDDAPRAERKKSEKSEKAEKKADKQSEKKRDEQRKPPREDRSDDHEDKPKVRYEAEERPEEDEENEEEAAERPRPKKRESEPARGKSAGRPETEAAADREEEVVPLSPLRRRIAERLVAAQRNAALLTTFNEIDMSAVKSLRAEHGEAFRERYGVKLGFMSFFVKGVVDALRQFPQLNAELRDDEIVYRNYHDIGIAIGGGKGLVVPVLRDAAHLSFAEIEQKIADFGERARRNALEVDELRGGTFTISNGGIYGSLLSTPIVNPPQSGVLGMHAIQDRPVVVNGEIAIRPMMYVALTYDHRLVDGREAVTFLKRVKDVVEEPARMLLEA